MPTLGADMEVGTILEWRIAPGDTVHRGDIVAVVDTEKSTIEVEIFEDGVVEELLVAPGVEVAVGTPLARIASPVGAVASPVAPAPVAAPAPAPVPPAPAPIPQPEPALVGALVGVGADTGFVRASPRARREAAAQGLDLATLRGSGPGGAVLVGDLVAPAAPPLAAPPPAAPPTEVPAPAATSGMRHAIGVLMARSKREIPHYYLATTVDLGDALRWLAEANERRPITERILPAALLLKATALAAREVPAMNGFWDGGFRPSAAVHLGVAVSLRGGGLVAPAIHDADQLDLAALMEKLRDLVRRARAGVLRGSEMADPTITVTNLGDQGVEEVFAVIYPPQVAMVGFGKVSERPWVVDGALAARPTVRASLAADHRASDGHDGARFLAAVDRLLRAPEEL